MNHPTGYPGAQAAQEYFVSDRPIIEWDRAMRDRLRKAYNDAVVKGLDVFEFEGNQYVTQYAKYLLEYLDGILGA